MVLVVEPDADDLLDAPYARAAYRPAHAANAREEWRGWRATPHSVYLGSMAPPSRTQSLYPTYWLTYRQGDMGCIMIVRAPSPSAARRKASSAIGGIDDHFVEWHELPPDVAKRVPERVVRRLLSADEARELLDAMAR